MNPTKRILGWLAVVATLFAFAAPVQAQPKAKRFSIEQQR